MNIEDILNADDLPEWHAKEPLPDHVMRDQRTQEQLLKSIWRSDPAHPDCWMWMGRLRDGGGTPGRFWPRWVEYRANSEKYEPERVAVAVWRSFMDALDSRTHRLVSTCRVKACVNPLHHRAMTDTEWLMEQRERQRAAAEPRLRKKAERVAKQQAAAERNRSRKAITTLARSSKQHTIAEWRELYAHWELAFPDVSHLSDDPTAKYPQSALRKINTSPEDIWGWVA